MLSCNNPNKIHYSSDYIAFVILLKQNIFALLSPVLIGAKCGQSVLVSRGYSHNFVVCVNCSRTESRKQGLKRQQQQQQQLPQQQQPQQQPQQPHHSNNNHDNNNCPVYNMRNLPAFAELVHSKNKKDYLMTLLPLLLASAKRAERGEQREC